MSPHSEYSPPLDPGIKRKLHLWCLVSVALLSVVILAGTLAPELF